MAALPAHERFHGSKPAGRRAGRASPAAGIWKRRKDSPALLCYVYRENMGNLRIRPGILSHWLEAMTAGLAGHRPGCIARSLVRMHRSCCSCHAEPARRAGPGGKDCEDAVKKLKENPENPQALDTQFSCVLIQADSDGRGRRVASKLLCCEKPLGRSGRPTPRLPFPL